MWLRASTRESGHQRINRRASTRLTAKCAWPCDAAAWHASTMRSLRNTPTRCRHGRDLAVAAHAVKPARGAAVTQRGAEKLRNDPSFRLSSLEGNSPAPVAIHSRNGAVGFLRRTPHSCTTPAALWMPTTPSNWESEWLIRTALMSSVDVCSSRTHSRLSEGAPTESPRAGGFRPHPGCGGRKSCTSAGGPNGLSAQENRGKPMAGVVPCYWPKFPARGAQVRSSLTH